MTAPPSRSLSDIVATLTAQTTPYLSCDECFEQICAYVESVAEHRAYRHPDMERHLRACPVCADEAASLLELITSGVPGAPDRAGGEDGA